MAAEKLTKGRLAQILFMMFILVCAFTWRSLTHSNNEALCHIGQSCTITREEMTINLTWNEESKKYRISVRPINSEMTVNLVSSNADLSAMGEEWLLKINALPTRIKLSKPTHQPMQDLYINFR